MNKFKEIATVAVLIIGTYVLMSSLYTVSEVEQMIVSIESVMNLDIARYHNGELTSGRPESKHYPFV